MLKEIILGEVSLHSAAKIRFSIHTENVLRRVCFECSAALLKEARKYVNDLFICKTWNVCVNRGRVERATF